MPVALLPSPPSLLSFSELLTQTLQGLEAKSTLISWFGRRSTSDEPAGVIVTSVLLTPTGLSVLRGRASAADSYPCLTNQYPQAQIFERELWEQTGLVPEGHPWLKPVRFEGARQEHLADYPFFKVRGAQVHEVGVGPIHAGVIEPGHFRFMCHGEQVQHLEIQLGYQHRGVEAMLLQKPAARLTPLVESMIGDSAVAYAWAFNAGLESLAQRTIAPATLASRAIGLELERVAMHLATLAGLATDIAYLQPASTYQRLRTAIINASQRACGNRFGRGWIRPSAAIPIGEALRTDLRNTLQAFLPDLLQVNALFTSSRSTQVRLQGVGTVTNQTALDLGLTGVVARASGVAIDLRHAAQAPTQESGDCWARARQRITEMEASTQWLIDQLADPALNLTDTPDPFAPNTTSNAWTLAPNTMVVSLIEGVRGPVMVALETTAGGQLLHAKVQDPSLANWFGLAFAMRKQQISDFPICNKSFDLSYCGNDL